MGAPILEEVGDGGSIIGSGIGLQKLYLSNDLRVRKQTKN